MILRALKITHNLIHQASRAEAGASAAAASTTDTEPGEVWSINRLGIVPQHLDLLKAMYKQTDSQVQKDFLEDLHCLLTIERATVFRDHLLLVNVTGEYVEYQERYTHL